MNQGDLKGIASELSKINPDEDLQRIETALKQSQEKYQNIIEEIADGYLEIDLAGNITFVNNAYCRVSSRPRDELIGLNYKKFTNEKAAHVVYKAFHKVFITGMPNPKLVHEMIKKDGSRGIVESSVSLLRDPQGHRTGFRVICRDITERKRTEEELASHRSRLEAIFSSVKDAIITVNTDGKVTDANKATESICDVVVNGIVGRSFRACLNQCQKSCHDIVKETLRRRASIREYQIECRHRNRIDQVVVVSSSPLLSPAGKFLGAVLVIRDITRLKDLERELRERHQFQNIIGKSKKMQEIYALLENLANVETTILVTGESGTGKDLIARAIHYSGERAFKPFVTVNCSALTESLLESELFGHVKGAFTGAIKDKVGRFEAASGGTILLDEIGDISPLIQLKLLRVLQEKEFERVGESTPQRVDVRIIACTNKDLKARVKKGEFRQDLYYRLKVVEIPLPALRDRLEDLPLLVNHFCHLFNERFNKNIGGVSSEVLSKFMRYSWPGNVRELEHVMEHGFVLCRGDIISLEHLPCEIKDYESFGKIQPESHDKNSTQQLLDALVKSHWNKTKAARLLGINRRTIYRKIHLLGESANDN